MVSERSILRVIPARKGGSANWLVKHDPQNPPDIVFDTNVWISLNQSDIESLKKLEFNHGFRYRYSVTNYCELLSHLEDEPSDSCSEPFIKYRQCFRKITELCHSDVLPSPEMELLALAGLECYLDPVWIPDLNQTAVGIETIANASSLSDLRGDTPSRLPPGIPRYVVKPSHYQALRDTDGTSFRKIMSISNGIQPPIRGSDQDKLTKLGDWFLRLAGFFFLVRASRERVHLHSLSTEEINRFVGAFQNGAGKLFHTHCVIIAKNTINQRRTINPNDLYDAMQLLYLRNDNRLFVTDDRFFFYYEIDPEIQRVLPWSAFKSSA